MERYTKRPAFVSLKDHKKNFKHNTKCYLINHSKGEMGVTSKRFLEEINNKLNKICVTTSTEVPLQLSELTC